ncbi:MAG: hypothetical protein IT371_19800 [Deltaproteobacteria bacterium]|nr:hypothetical protein [Deltaproteobacteria bacterium]
MNAPHQKSRHAGVGVVLLAVLIGLALVGAAAGLGAFVIYPLVYSSLTPVLKYALYVICALFAAELVRRGGRWIHHQAERRAALLRASLEQNSVASLF